MYRKLSAGCLGAWALMALSACNAPSLPAAGEGEERGEVRGECLGATVTGAVSIVETATWILDGVPEIDNALGARSAVGDLDGDGLDDLVTTGHDSEVPNVYLVLGSRLQALGPGRYAIADIAASTITLEHWTSCGSSGSCSNGYEAAFRIEPGKLYIGNAVSWDKPLAYLLTWPTLKAAGNVGPHAVADVADVALLPPDRIDNGAVGDSIQVCDPNGDGHQDLLLASENGGYPNSYPDGPGYLLPGPFSATELTADVDGVPMYYASHVAVEPYSSDTRWGPNTLGTCRDYNGDGFDDISMSGRDPLSPDETILGIYYGGPSFGASGIVDLVDADVLLQFEPDPDASARYLQTSLESVADWDGDGNMEFLARRYAWYVDDGDGWESDVSVFAGGTGFYPSGTVLAASDRFLSVVDPEGPFMGEGISFDGDSNLDGYPEMALGYPSQLDDVPGVVLLRGCPLGAGDYNAATFAETTIEGEDAAFGGVVIASGDINGNGASDLVIGPASWRGIGGIGVIGTGAVYIVAR